MVGYATRPVQLFYGLSQLGRSIAAASKHLTDGPTGNSQSGHGRGERGSVEVWRLSGHGIATPSLRERSRAGLSAVMVKGQSHGTAPGVARALSSAPLPTDREVSLVDLWAMLPEAREVPAVEFAGKPQILQISYEYEQEWSYASSSPLGPAVTHVNLAKFPASHDDASLSNYLSWYPGLGQPRPPDEWRQTRMTWVANQDDVKRGWADGWDRGVVPSLPHVTYRNTECAVPVIAEMSEPVHPITIWWAVLFTLSMMARYEPDTWSTFIDVDSSACASAIEHTLDAALDAVPNLVLTAFDEMGNTG